MGRGRVGEVMGDAMEGEQTVFTVGEEEGGLVSWENGKADVQ